MYRLIYVSSTTRPLALDEMLERAKHAKAHGEKLGITGLHVYRNGNNFSVIEGDEAAVKERYADACSSNMHKDQAILSEGEIQGREFDDWKFSYDSADNNIIFSKIHAEFDYDGCLHILEEMIKSMR